MQSLQTINAAVVLFNLIVKCIIHFEINFWYVLAYLKVSVSAAF